MDLCQILATQTGFQIPLYILDDLCARFVINLPEEESRDPIRVFFQIELAQWFYLDFYCPENPELRPLNIKDFSTQVFRHCPSLSKHVSNFDTILESWREYKMAVPTYGAILLDPTLQHCLLVQGYWVKASWGFPKGKVNQDEPPIECAIREVLEETGYDIRDKVRSSEYLEYKMNEQLSRLYIITGVPRDTKFQAQTRNEIKGFEWFRVEHLPSHKKDLTCKQNLGLNANAFFMVIPFVKNLRRWISHQSQQQGPVAAAAAAAAVGGATGGSVDIEVGPQNTVDSKVSRSARDNIVRTRQHSTGSSLSLPGPSDIKTRSRTTPAGTAAGPGAASVGGSRQESVSPRQPTTRKQQKRDKTDNKPTPSDVVSSQAASDEQFVCPAWTHFKLDIDTILAAMFPTHNALHH